MRLVCPNCDAIYEVDDSVIPEGGRDVQCSNCGHTWFQNSADQLAEDAQVEPEQAEIEEEITDSVSEDDDEIAPESEETAPETPEPPRQELDDSVRDILREEAAFESRARAEDGGSLETQDEMPLESAPPETDDAVSRLISETMAEAEAEEEVVEATPETESEDPATRRDLLPDIEEINSTLTATSEREAEESAADEAAALPARRSGFRRGFLIMILLLVIATLIYVYAAKIVEAVPASQSIMESYVNWVNSLRLWLDSWMSSAVDGITEITNGSDG